jgi:single-stranded-DNA-specific exonuclease
LKLERIEWMEPEPVQFSVELLQAAGNDPILAEALTRRGILNPGQAAAFLDPSKYCPAMPQEIPDMDIAVQRLSQAIASGEIIGVWGDFDADGQTSTSILYASLQILGARVEYYIPVRARESHGVSLPALESFLKRGVTLILTCDTGVTAHDAVDFGRKSGVDFIITDHHTLPPVLPDAVAVVNPQRLPEDHPLRPMCGAGTAFKLAEALFDHYDRKAEASQFLDLAAIGTIADLAILSGDNRYLVQTGLEQIRRNPRPAIKVLLDQADINYAQLSEEHISYIVAPRLNALGRLADANPAVSFLH